MDSWGRFIDPLYVPSKSDIDPVVCVRYTEEVESTAFIRDDFDSFYNTSLVWVLRVGDLSSMDSWGRCIDPWHVPSKSDTVVGTVSSVRGMFLARVIQL